MPDLRKDETGKLAFLRGLNEAELRSNILLPLFVAMGFSNVSVHHGTLEFGKDIVFYEDDRFGERVFYGVAVKAQNIHGAVGKSGSVSSVFYQAQQARMEPWLDPSTARPHDINCVIIATSGKITQEAIASISNRMRGENIRFLDGAKIIALIDRYAPHLYGGPIPHGTSPDGTHDIPRLWAAINGGRAGADRGRDLERLMKAVFESVPGFVDVIANVHSSTEEIDLILRNESSDPFWSQQGPFIMIECKSWSKEKVGRTELDHFSIKMSRRAGWCRVGFFVSLTGFSKAFLQEVTRTVQTGILIVPLDHAKTEALVSSRSRKDLLKRFVLESLTI
jgi:Restriction endonuclease